MIYTNCALTNYDPDMAFNAYKLTAAAYTDNDESLITQCLTDTFGAFQNLAHSTFNCYKGDDSCTGIFATFPSKNLTIISFRGTKNFLSYLHQIENAYSFVPYDSVNNNYGYVEKYYRDVAGSMKYLITGHSLGGALAVMTALKIVTTLTANPQDVQVFTFGQPRIGDYEFAQNVVQRNLPNLYRLVHNKDIIPHFPACSTKIGDTSVCLQESKKPYHHTVEVFYNNNKNSFQYVLCDANNGEDPSCSDGLNIIDNIEGLLSDYHNTYFDINIEKFGKRGCQNSANRILSYSFFILFATIFRL